MQELIYRVYHLRQNIHAAMDRSPFHLDKAFEQKLSSHNVGTGSFDAGWTVTSLTGGREVVVEKDGLRLWISPHEFVADSIRVGEVGAIRLEKEMRRASPGYYLALGNRYLDRESDLVRIYWNIRSEGALPVMSHATEILNQRDVPFHLKVVRLPRHFDRTDAAVLYINRGDLLAGATDIAAIHEAMGPYLKSVTSAFAKSLASGVSLAEDYGSTTSFGEQVSGLFAAGLRQAYEKGRRSPEGTADEVLACIRARGVDPARLYLRPGSRSDYSQLERVFE